VFYKEGADTTILLGIEDVTVRRKLEHEKDDLLRQKDILLEEIQHRIANSLQIIAGIILMKANTVSSEETRPLLRDIHDRVISIAAVQQQLHASGAIGPIEVVSYLTRLSDALATSMIGDARPVTLKVTGDAGTLSSRQAESIGLITTELVMNCLKHAFPKADTNGQIMITYETDGTDWKLSIADNGIGKQDGVFAQPKTGLGTGIVKALAQDLNAKVETVSGIGGTTISVVHTTFSKAGSRAA
jgi:chemotaxis protein methyltransferase CheR